MKLFLRVWVCCWCVVLFGATTRSAVAQPERPASVHVEAGWGGRVRPGAWNPVVVTVRARKPTAAILRIDTPHDSINSMGVSVALTATPEPETYTLVVPLTFGLSTTTATLTDARTGDVLDRVAFAKEDAEFNPYSASSEVIQVGDRFVGISGDESAQRMLSRQLDAINVKSGYLDPKRLPTTPTGYDGIDALVLANVNLVTLGADQQLAIAQWVRGGGQLVVWPSADVVPPVDDIVDLLPGTFGDNVQFDAPPAALKSAGLAERFVKLRSREFKISPDARPIRNVGRVIGASALRGFGQVVALAPDVAQLQFDSTELTRAFWEPVLGKLFTLPDPKSNVVTYNSADELRRSNSMQFAMDLIGQIPGVGRFDFKYVAIVLCGLILVVGPIDYFVLRKAKRQPLTWITTAGWIVLVTTAAVFAGRFIKSGDLHLRTLRFVDQADGRVVGSTDLVCVYSPQTTEYDLSVEEHGWWRPAAPEQTYYRREPTASTIDFHQDPRGNRVAEGALQVNIWNLKFLEGRTTQAEDSIVDVKLKRSKSAGSMTGEITNRSPSALSGILVRTSEGAWKTTDTVGPNQSATVELKLDPNDRGQKTADELNQLRYQRTFNPDSGVGPEAQVEGAADLSPERSAGQQRWLDTSTDHAVLFATSSDAPSLIKLNGEKPREQHWLFVRSLVKITPGAGGDGL